MSRWQKRVRTAVALFGVAFATFLFFLVRGAKPRTPPVARNGAADREASVEATKGSVHSLGIQGEKWKLDYDRSLMYGDGRQKLTNARVFVPQRGGRDFRLTGREAETSAGVGQDQLTFRGAVELTASDGMSARTEEAMFNRKEGVLRVPRQVAFARKLLSGSATGMTYDQNRDVMSLLADTVLRLGASKAADAPTTITAVEGSLARREHYARFAGGFRLVTGSRVLESEAATAYLTDDDARVTTLEMRGHARISGLGEGVGTIRDMEADEANLEFAPDGRTLAGATLAKNAVMNLQGAAAGAGGRRLSAQWIDIRLGADGATVSALTARDNLLLDLPATADEPARTISAGALTAKGDAGRALTAATFTGNVIYRELRVTASGRSTRQVTGRVLDVATQPGFGDIDDARFTGAVRFDEDQLTAAAGAARYQVKRGVIDLSGIDDSTGRVPRVGDGQVTIDASAISMSVDQRQITARQDVRSTMVPASDGRAGQAGQVHRAAMLKANEPVYATAGQLVYDGLSHGATYTKDARLWQGDTAISGDTVTVDDATGNLGAAGNVRSTMTLEQTDVKTKKAERTASVAVAEKMVYDDAVRRATYTGNAHMTGRQGDVMGDRIEMYLKASGSELDRVEAYDRVILRLPDKWATGARLTYFADDARYVMTGTPVKVCSDDRETTGTTLKYDQASNRITVDGNEEHRTQTKSATTCGEPRRH